VVIPRELKMLFQKIKKKKAALGDKVDLFPEKGDKSITLAFIYAITVPLSEILYFLPANLY
jgi:hypothetical protein